MADLISKTSRLLRVSGYSESLTECVAQILRQGVESKKPQKPWATMLAPLKRQRTSMQSNRARWATDAVRGPVYAKYYALIDALYSELSARRVDAETRGLSLAKAAEDFSAEFNFTVTNPHRWPDWVPPTTRAKVRLAFDKLYNVDVVASGGGTMGKRLMPFSTQAVRRSIQRRWDNMTQRLALLHAEAGTYTDDAGRVLPDYRQFQLWVEEAMYTVQVQDRHDKQTHEPPPKWEHLLSPDSQTACAKWTQTHPLMLPPVPSAQPGTDPALALQELRKATRQSQAAVLKERRVSLQAARARLRRATLEGTSTQAELEELYNASLGKKQRVAVERQLRRQREIEMQDAYADAVQGRTWSDVIAQIDRLLALAQSKDALSAVIYLEKAQRLAAHASTQINPTTGEIKTAAPRQWFYLLTPEQQLGYLEWEETNGPDDEAWQDEAFLVGISREAFVQRERAIAKPKAARDRPSINSLHQRIPLRAD